MGTGRSFPAHRDLIIMLLSILKVVFIILEVLILFNLLIIVHEWGHFLAARWRGLVVEKFGIWFGKPIWKKTVNGVEYSLGSIPAGGFVALPQMAPMEAMEGKGNLDRSELPRISVLDKIVVAFAGPLFSFLLAVVFAVVVWAVGRPVSTSELTTTIGYVEAGSPAAKAGLKPGDRILEVDGKPVRKFMGMIDSVTWNVVRSEGETIPFKVERDGETLVLEPKPIKSRRRGWGRSGLRQVLIAPKLTPLVGRVEPDSPAAKAGIRVNDLILKVNGSELLHPQGLSDVIRNNPESELELEIGRGKETKTVRLTAVQMPVGKAGKTMPRIGIVWDMDGEMGLVHPTPAEQVVSSVMTVVKTFDALLSPKSDIKPEHMSGPVMIMRIYYLMFESENGWRHALWFSVVLNVNLALLNLLPIPVLDGGHILLALVEGVRRKPVNSKLIEVIQTACALLIIGYMLYVTFFDVQDLPIFNGETESVESAPTPDPPE